MRLSSGQPMLMCASAETSGGLSTLTDLSVARPDVVLLLVCSHS